MEDRNGHSWDFYGVLIIISFAVLQLLRSSIFPQFIDGYYHLQTAWGFCKAGGYSTWDFWQYAPVGRPHIYPPVYHLILSIGLKLGVNKIVLAKFMEFMIPIVFLCTLWQFIRKHYTSRLACFVMVSALTSFSFYLSLCNNIPATLACIAGLFAFGQLFQGRRLRAAILLAVCFYTHIGVSWFFFVSTVLLGLFTPRYRRIAFTAAFVSFILALPLLETHLRIVHQVSLEGIGEKYFLEFKLVEYLLAFFAVGIMLKQASYRLFLVFFIASFVFLPYPYRFISGQGYFAILLLSALGLDFLYEKAKAKSLFFRWAHAGLVAYCLFFSVTVLMEKKPDGAGKLSYKAYCADATLPDMLFPSRNERITSASVWFPREYLPLSKLIIEHSQDNEIIYSSLPVAVIVLASISDRASANGLLPEISPQGVFYPFLASKLVIFPKDSTLQEAMRFIHGYQLKKVGETDMFKVYVNPLATATMKVRKADVPFVWLFVIFLSGALCFWQDKRMEEGLTKFSNFLLTRYAK